MVEEIITIFLICADFLEMIDYKDDKQVKMTTSEVMTTAIVSTKFFGGNFNEARVFLKEHNYISDMLSESRLIRRFHGIDENVWISLSAVLSRIFKESNKSNEYLIDSFPIPVCSNIRINRCKIYKGKKFKGFVASKREFFYGIRIHMLVTSKGEPVEFIIRPGAEHDIKAAKKFTLNLFKGAKIYADKGYTDYVFEDNLAKERKIFLIAQRKTNSKRIPFRYKYQKKKRKLIETVFSLIVRKFPNRIHAVTARGFELKVLMFIFAYAITLF